MNLVYEMVTSKSVSDAVLAVKENLKSHGFGVLWELDFKTTLGNKGIEFNEDYIVLEVCDPKQAKSILDLDMQAGYVLPCKMAVRSENGKTFIGLTNPKTLLGFYESKELDSIGEVVENTLKEVVQESI